MSTLPYSRVQLANSAEFSERDLAEIKRCRHNYTQLGFGYQLAFVKMFNQFPTQKPLNVVDEVVNFVSLQLGIGAHHIHRYEHRRKTLSEHQEIIRRHLALRLFSSAILEVEDFLFKAAYSLEQMGALIAHLRAFLKQNGILEPSQDTMQRIIQTQREAARIVIYNQIYQSLSAELCDSLDALLKTKKEKFSPLHYLKQPPGNVSPAAFNKLIAKLEHIQNTKIQHIDITWLNNNFQRALARYARHCSIYRLRRLKKERRYAVLVCFLKQLYQDTLDAMVDMYDKLINKVHNRADNDVNDYLKKRRRQIRVSLIHYQKVLDVLLNGEVEQEAIRSTIFNHVDENTLKVEKEELDTLLNSRYHETFYRVVDRHGYLRQFAPALLKHMNLQVESNSELSDELLNAVSILKQMNQEGRYKLPDDVPTDFIPKKLRSLIIQEEKPSKPAWECALLTVIRDQIKSGNISVQNSKRFATLEKFFMPQSEWERQREKFFIRAGLPADPGRVVHYLTSRLEQAYDDFLKCLPNNRYAQLRSGRNPGKKASNLLGFKSIVNF